MRLDTVPGYALAFVTDPLYGLPKPVNVGVYRLGDYDPSGNIPPGHQLFLGTGEAFNSWKHKFEEDEEKSIGIVIRIRLAGFRSFESLGQLEQIDDAEGGEPEQWLTLSDSHKLMHLSGIKELETNLKKAIASLALHGKRKD